MQGFRPAPLRAHQNFDGRCSVSLAAGAGAGRPCAGLAASDGPATVLAATDVACAANIGAGPSPGVITKNRLSTPIAMGPRGARY